MDHFFFNDQPYCFFNKNDIQLNLENEWLITNSHGSYASGTISGVLTRKYHGIFVIAKYPPLTRYLSISKIEEIIEYDNSQFLLYSNYWQNSKIQNPTGHLLLESFYLDENMPVWIYNCNGLLLEKRIILHYEKNILCVNYKILNKDNKLAKIKCNIFVNNRNFHSIKNDETFEIKSFIDNKIIYIKDNKYNNNIKIIANFKTCELNETVYNNYYLKEEDNRGFEALENHLYIGSLNFDLSTSKNADILIMDENEFYDNQTDNSLLFDIKQYNNFILSNWFEELDYSPKWILQLVYNSVFFIIKKFNSVNEYYYSIIAGYHWFGDWGRDTMISLPGLCLVTGRTKIAHSILINYSHYLHEGLLPNRFPDESEKPDYNTVDASLWYFNAVFLYFKFTGDKNFIDNIYDVLISIIDWHIKGTKFNIKLDPVDGLIFAGQEGSQLTWMDAKIGDYVVTPRIGKPIEINALWFNALNIMLHFSRILNKNQEDFYTKLIDKTKIGFQQFWNEELQYCFDVLSADNKHDDSLRPNQIFAISLEYSPLTLQQKRCIIDSCGRFLLSPYGLKTLPKFSSHYHNKYIGSPFARDCAYHQGTIWGWLLGHYAVAFYKVTKNKKVSLGFLEPLEHHIKEAGMGFISEIFDADYPHTARGCIAQAWSVGETLYAWYYINKN